MKNRKKWYCNSRLFQEIWEKKIRKNKEIAEIQKNPDGYTAGVFQ